MLRLHIDAATVALCRVRRSELRLEKDRHLYGGGSGQTITIGVLGEPELRAGRALLLAAADHLEGAVSVETWQIAPSSHCHSLHVSVSAETGSNFFLGRPGGTGEEF